MASVQAHKNRFRVKWRDAAGRALYESFPTREEAEQAARRIEAQTVLAGQAPAASDPNALTLAGWWRRWEPGRAWRPSSRYTHNWHWRCYIEPVFGRVALDAITSADIRRFHRKLEGSGLAPVSVAGIARTLSMLLNGAVEDDLIVRNPAARVTVRRTAANPPVALDADTLTALLDTIAMTDPEAVTFAQFVAATGVRRSEATGLTWDRVDLDAGVVIIDRQLDYTASTLPAWSETKNKRSRRVLLTGTTVSMLKTHRAAQTVATIDGTGLVFTRRDRPWSCTALRNVWMRARDQLSKSKTPLPTAARGWHTLRHTTASRLLERGVPVADAADMLGHTPAQLLTTYAHITDRSESDARLRAALDA